MNLTAREVSGADTVPLRRDILRAGSPLAVFPGDHDAFHLGVYDGLALVGCGNIRLDPAPWAPDVPAWRIRGMATATSHRGQGVGTLVLEGLLARCRSAPPLPGEVVLWCNARTPAQPFYERAGFLTRGQSWVDPEIGPHIVMWRSVGGVTTGAGTHC